MLLRLCSCMLALKWQFISAMQVNDEITQVFLSRNESKCPRSTSIIRLKASKGSKSGCNRNTSLVS